MHSATDDIIVVVMKEKAHIILLVGVTHVIKSLMCHTVYLG